MKSDLTRRNVLMLASWYPDEKDPSNGIFIKRYAETVAAFCKISLIYVTTVEDLDKTYSLDAQTVNNVFTVRACYKTPRLKIPVVTSILKTYRYLRVNLKAYFVIWKKQGKPDIVHCHVIYKAGLFALVLKKLEGLPYIISEQWSVFLKERRSLNHEKIKNLFLIKIILRNASAVTTVSAALKDAMLNEGFKNKYFVVPNVVNTDLFTLPEVKTENEKRIIIHIASLEQESKNTFDIIRSIALLHSLRQDFALQIVGDGKNKNECIALVDELQLKNEITFHGNIPGDEVVKLLQQSDLLLLYSFYETFGCVVIEAWSCGVPVVTSDIPAMTEKVKPFIGVTVKSANPQALAEQLNYMLDHYKNYDQNEIRKYAIDNFSSNVVAEKFNEVYNIVLDKNESEEK